MGMHLDTVQHCPFHWYRNPRAVLSDYYPPEAAAIIHRPGIDQAMAVIQSWPGYAATPLLTMPRLAERLGVQNLYYKHESSRFGLGSFKGLGGAYAVFRLLSRIVEEKTGQDLTPSELLSGAYRHITQHITVTTATDGNHGRSVAWGAQQFGCKSVIYIHAHVSEGREKAIAGYGAKVVRIEGNYDDSVRQAQKDADSNGWFVISDTSYPGYTAVPKDVMLGYCVMVEEALEQMAPSKPTHLFLQGGVGAVAAAVAGYFWEAWGKERPRIVVVEPEKADCLYQSAKAGKIVSVTGKLDTMMAGLACGEVSILAWDILNQASDGFLTIPDEAAMGTMRYLASGELGDVRVVAGESAVAGLAGLMMTAASSECRAALGLNESSRVLIFGTEGATDPELYSRIVGHHPSEIPAAC